MTQEKHAFSHRAKAAWRQRLLLAWLVGALASPSLAQDSLPSVSDYRLPSGTSTPRVQPQGPVDPENPEASPPRTVRPAEPAPEPAPEPAAAPSRRASASPSTSPTPAARPSTSARPAAAQASPQATASRASAPSPAAPRPASPAAVAPAPAASASAPPSAPVIEWRVHSAADKAAGGQSWWQSPWLAGLAFLGGVGLVLLLQAVWRRRRGQHAASSRDAIEVSPPPVPSPVPKPELDLLSVMAEPPTTPAPSAAAPRPALNLLVNPLEVELAARRMSATLMNAVLHYELIVRNTGSAEIGPVTIGGDMIGAHASLPDRAQLELSGQQIVPLHRLARLAAGESATLAGEFKLSLADITPIRSGNAALFIPLARFRVEAARPGAPPLVANSAFVIGEDQDRPGTALRPFRLDLGPRLYSRLGQRELALSA